MPWAILSFYFSMVALGNASAESYTPWLLASLMALMAAIEAQGAQEAINVAKRFSALTDRLIEKQRN